MGLASIPAQKVRHPLAHFFDHTLLDHAATRGQIEGLCDEALAHGFYGVCIYPEQVVWAVERLAGAPLAVVTVIDFPEGTMATRDKAAQARQAVADGATEVDMVLNRELLLANEYRAVEADVAAVVAAAQGRTVKVIVESAALDHVRLAQAAALALAGGAAWLKTSTGYGPGGATKEAVALLRRLAPASVGIKASGGIRSLAQARAMVAAGATRLGTSASVAIVGQAD